MELIESVELASSASSITFSSIPQTYTDLKILVSARTVSGDPSRVLSVNFNGSSANLTAVRLQGNGSSVTSSTAPNDTAGFVNGGSDTTANTFSNTSLYISNYASSSNKSFSSDGVTENNGTTAFQQIAAGLWSNTSAITSVELFPDVGVTTYDFDTGSTFTLYGITAGGSGTVS